MGQKYTVRGLTAHSGSVMETAGGPVLQFGRKPFDWMSDSQWQMLLVIVQMYIPFLVLVLSFAINIAFGIPLCLDSPYFGQAWEGRKRCRVEDHW